MVEYRVLHTKLVWGNLENIYKDISWEKLGRAAVVRRKSYRPSVVGPAW